MIRKFFNWLLRPVVLSFIGVLLLSLIIWFEAPLLAFDGKEPFGSTTVRWTFIWLLFLAWAVYFLWKWAAATLANRRLMKSVAGADAPPPVPGQKESAAEMALLTRRLQEAMGILRKARIGGGSAGLYQLPWYMFVGAPGSGKTTALVHSGLKFPLTDSHGKGAIGGVGGTRNCDWWFTDEAVLLDTAGRYTTQDSYTEVDRAAWNGFLQLLRKHRRRRPINGIIVALSVADLLQQGEAARRTQALAIRGRIKELHEQLGIRFPVYVVVTKVDLLAGFVEFFDNLGRDERTQVWGVTFPVPPAGGKDDDEKNAILKSFPAEFIALEGQLQARLFERMQLERDVQRRAMIYNFPQQFAAIGDVLATFLNDVFETTSYEEAALLRGVYFTSGTQEGSPIDRVMSTLAASFGLDRKVLPANAFGGRSYFITRLLREVIFQEQGLAGANLKLERNRKLLQWAAIGLTALVLVLLSAGLLTSYVRNQNYVRDVAVRSHEIDTLARAMPDDPSPLVTLPLLNALRDIPGGYRDRNNDVPFLMTLGLYQGDKLGDGAVRAYQRFLRETLLPRIQSRMETELRRGSANNSDYLYELLRVYIMLGDRSHLDPAAVQAWLEFDWSRNLPESNEAQRADLSSHVAALLDTSSTASGADAPPQLDAALIAQTRLILARMPMGDRVYNRIRRDLQRARIPDFDVAAVSGRDAPVVLTRQSGQPLTRGVSGVYTLAGFKKFNEQIDAAIADVVRDNWVLDQRDAVNSLEGAAQMKASVQQMYYEDYIRQWDALLADVVLVPFTTLDQAARVIGSITGQESPMRKFLLAATRQTMLDKVKTMKSGVDAASDTVKQLGDAARKRLDSVLSSGTEDAPAAAEARPVNPVDMHFDALHKMVAAGGGAMGAGGQGGQSGLDAVLLKLKDVAVYFDAVNSARAAGQPAPPADALAKLKREAAGLPPPLSLLLQNVDTAGSGLTLGTERDRLDALWKTGPALFCRAAIAGRYPLARKSAQDVTPDDFGRYFGPGGLVDDFFQKHLLNYVDVSGPQWRWRTVNNMDLGISQEVLNEFQRAAAIRDKFFGLGGKQASLRFDIRPISADASLTRVVLDIDGQQLAFAPKVPQGAMTFQIPSGKGVNAVRFDVAPASTTELKTEGPWAFFRMLDRGVVEQQPQGERFKLTFDLDNRKMIYDLTANSVNNPFKRDAMEQFRCLDKL
jgi:type VI secretion system protein ImpL